MHIKVFITNDFEHMSQVAADILKTGLSPTWEDILLLAAIIGLRTLLNYLLERELEMLDPVQQATSVAQTECE